MTYIQYYLVSTIKRDSLVYAISSRTNTNTVYEKCDKLALAG